MRYTNLIPLDTKFYKLTVIDNTVKNKTLSSCICKCDCGNITTPIVNGRLRAGYVRHCGCDTVRHGDIVGKTYGNLLILNEVGKSSCGHKQYLCLCSCGKTTTVLRSHLLAGSTKSCGCLLVTHIKSIKRNYRISIGKHPDHLLTPELLLERQSSAPLLKQIKQRDNFTCKLCGVVGGTLHVHHIVPFAENISLRNDPTNLVTLCKCCHLSKAHLGSPNKLNYDIQDILIERMKE